MATKSRKKQRAQTRNVARQERKKRAAAAKPYDGPAVELLCDDDAIPGDMRMIRKAVTESWPVNRDIMQDSVSRLNEIQNKKTVLVPCGEGTFPSEAVADANAIKAAALLKSMVDANTKAKQAEKPKPQTTINVGVNVDNRSTDERGHRLTQIAQRLGIDFVPEQRDGRSTTIDSQSNSRT